MTAPADHRGPGTALAAVGAALGVLAGIVQATVGSQIPGWTGAKASPGALGVLTVVLSLIAGAGCATIRWARVGTGARLAAIAAIAVPALVCFTTVGRLWLIPGPLLLLGAGLCVGSWREAAVATRRNWSRVLLAALGGCELLMAAGAAPVVMAVGAVGGAALILAAVVAGHRRPLAAGLIVLGTAPFAALAWTALVPVLVLLLAAALAAPVLSAPARGGRARNQPAR